MRQTLLCLAAAAFAATGLLATVPAHAAGQVEVKFTEADKFTDIGWGSFERERNLAALVQSFQLMTKRLPDGQTLSVEVLDVDLAGETRMGVRGDLRIVRGGVDWPRMELRYSLQAGGTTIKTGVERLSDMSYMFANRPSGSHEGSLPYEQRMLLRWFADTFTTGP